MNAEQWKTIISALVIFAGGLLGGYGVTRGWYTAEGLTSFLNGPIVGGLIAFLTTLVLRVMSKTAPNLASAAQAVAGGTFVTSPAVANATSNPNVVSSTDTTVVPK